MLGLQSLALSNQELQQGHLRYRSAAQSPFCNGSGISFLPQLAPDYQRPRAPFQSLFNAPLIIHFSDSKNAVRGYGFVTNKYQSNPHLQGTNEGNNNKGKESKLICFVAFNQTLALLAQVENTRALSSLAAAGCSVPTPCRHCHGPAGTSTVPLPSLAAERN